jgi:hypothetical protein
MTAIDKKNLRSCTSGVNSSLPKVCGRDIFPVKDCPAEIYNARRFNVDLSPYPTLRRIHDALGALPAFQAYLGLTWLSPLGVD